MSFSLQLTGHAPAPTPEAARALELRVAEELNRLVERVRYLGVDVGYARLNGAHVQHAAINGPQGPLVPVDSTAPGTLGGGPDAPQEPPVTASDALGGAPVIGLGPAEVDPPAIPAGSLRAPGARPLAEPPPSGRAAGEPAVPFATYPINVPRGAGGVPLVQPYPGGPSETVPAGTPLDQSDQDDPSDQALEPPTPEPVGEPAPLGSPAAVSTPQTEAEAPREPTRAERTLPPPPATDASAEEKKK